MKKSFSKFLFLFYNFLLTSQHYVHASVYRGSSREDGIFYRRFKNTKFYTGNTVISTVYVKNLYDCAKSCVEHSSCQAFNIDLGDPENKACELLLKGGEYLLSSYLGTYTNWSYYDTQPQYFRTCRMYFKYYGQLPSSTLSLKPNPDRSDYAVVKCTFTGNEIRTEFVEHGSSTRVDGYPSPASYTYYAAYDGSREQGKVLADISDRCEQYVFAEGYSTHVNWNAGTPNLIATNRHGHYIGFWGGGNSNRYCACGVSYSCSGGGECHNHGEINTYRTDSGHFKDKNLLPVYSIKVGDTGSDRSGGFTILGVQFWGLEWNKFFVVNIDSMYCYTPTN